MKNKNQYIWGQILDVINFKAVYVYTLDSIFSGKALKYERRKRIF